jgi:L-lactate dehydrogenase complex protein LldF
MSMKTSDLPLNERLEKELADKFMRSSIARAQDLLNQKRVAAFEELGNFEQWRENAAAVRSHVLENLDFYLNQFVDKATQNGAQVLFARNAREATDHALAILKKIRLSRR